MSQVNKFNKKFNKFDFRKSSSKKLDEVIDVVHEEVQQNNVEVVKPIEVKAPLGVNSVPREYRVEVLPKRKETIMEKQNVVENLAVDKLVDLITSKVVEKMTTGIGESIDKIISSKINEILSTNLMLNNNPIKVEENIEIEEVIERLPSWYYKPQYFVWKIMDNEENFITYLAWKYFDRGIRKHSDMDVNNILQKIIKQENRKLANSH